MSERSLAMASAGSSEGLDGLEILTSPYQHTLRHSFTLSGIGLHTGATNQVTIGPAAPHQGRYFLRTDGEQSIHVAAQLSAVYQTQRSTTLRQMGASIQTVEHLLAALVGMGIDNAQIQVQGLEVPILDGSAQAWVKAIHEVGCQTQSERRQVGVLHAPIMEQEGNAFVMALPHAHTLFSYGIDFPSTVIGRQWCSFSLREFASEIAPARTFGFANDVEALRAKGFIKGGSLENALVCDQTNWLNPPLRFTNEPVRHKLLDLIGDLSLLGVLPQAHFVAYKASHALHIRFAQKLQDRIAG